MAFTRMDTEDRVRPEGRNAILVYGYNEEEINALKDLMKEANIDELIYIDESIYDEKIKNILIRQEKNKTTSFFSHEDKVIVFNSTSQYQINTFITKLFKEVEVRPIVAMVTPTSAKWKFSALVEELKREKEALK